MKSLYRYALHHLPRPVLIRLSYLFRLVAPLLLKGNRVECPVCGGKYSRFLAYGSEVALRPNVLCPGCLSLERHRLLWLYLKAQSDFFTAPYRLLHIAPEQCFHGRFRKMKNLEYVTGDMNSPIADHHFDLHDIPFGDGSFDVIFCNHVLEHVRDDRRCMRELHRVLKPGGWAIMQVPIDYSRAATLEDPAITSPEDREKYYWQKDHVRLYGRDYPQRLTDEGFAVEKNNLAAQLGDLDAGRYRLQAKEVLYVCRK